MAEKIITEYEVVTQKSIENLQAVSNKLKETDANIAKTSATSTAALNKTAASANTTAKSFNGLSNSIGQVSRELPNFALNAQTGFLAISNNLPILFDNLQRVKEENLALAASGQKTTSVFKQVIGSIFSLNTALTLLISLSIIYGKELGIFFKSLLQGAEAFDTATLRLKSLNAAFDSKELKNGIKGIIELRNNIQLAKDGFISKELVVKQYNDTLGVAFGRVNNIVEAEKQLENNTKPYIEALIQRAQANKIIDEAAQTGIDIRKETDRLTLELQEKTKKELDLINSQKFASQEAYDKRVADLFKKNSLEQQKLNKTAASEDLRELEQTQANQFKLIFDLTKKSNEILNDENSLGGGAVKTAFELLNEEISKTKLAINNGVLGGANVSADLQKLADLEQKLRVIETTIARLQSPQDLPSAPDITTTLNPIDAKGIEQNVDIAEKELQRLNKLVQKNAKDSIKENEETAKYFAEQEKEKTKVVEEEARKRAQLEAQLREGALGLASTFENELFSLRRNNLQNQTQFELSELEKQRDNKSITEKQFNDRKNAILSDQAQKQRQLDLSEIKVKTALAIISAIARSPETFGLPFSAFAAAEGLIQYAFASSQPLPRFAKGTDRVKGGTKGQDSVLAMLMPDEAVIPAKENLKRPEMAKAWISGDLDRYLTMNYIRPAIEANNKAWEKQVNVNQSSQFIRNDNFNDKRIVKGLDSISRKLNRTEEKVVYKRNRRLWN